LNMFSLFPKVGRVPGKLQGNL